jgi:ribosomal 50S subunit-associated protein YjgA (DUF615 family)
LKYNTSAASKRIQWKGSLLSIPDVETIRTYINKAENGDRESADQLFRWYRFCGPVSNDQDVQSITLIVDAIKELFE